MENLRYQRSVIMTGYDDGLQDGRAEGRAEGLAEGLVEGRAKGLADVARAMLERGMDKKMISELSGLSEDEIEKLQ